MGALTLGQLAGGCEVSLIAQLFEVAGGNGKESASAPRADAVAVYEWASSLHLKAAIRQWDHDGRYGHRWVSFHAHGVVRLSTLSMLILHCAVGLPPGLIASSSPCSHISQIRSMLRQSMAEARRVVMSSWSMTGLPGRISYRSPPKGMQMAGMVTLGLNAEAEQHLFRQWGEIFLLTAR
jgi:hypothetical protein